MLEGLERRTLLAAAVSLVSGKLNITGTDAVDNVEISYSAGVTTVNDITGGVVHQFTDPVTTLVAQGRGGGDRLVVDDSFLAPSTIAGGDGDDFLRGGRGADKFEGGRGVDTVSYAGRSEGVVVDIDGNRDDGAPGELDD